MLLKEKTTVKFRDFCKILRHVYLRRADANLVSALILTSLSASELLLLSNFKYFVLEFIMNVNAARSSSVVSSDSETSSSSGQSLDEIHSNILQGGEVLGYQFEPRRDSNNGSGESADIEDDQNMSSEEDESVEELNDVKKKGADVVWDIRPGDGLHRLLP